MILELLELNMEHHQQLITWLPAYIQAQAVFQDQDWPHLNTLDHQELSMEPQELLELQEPQEPFHMAQLESLELMELDQELT